VARNANKVLSVKERIIAIHEEMKDLIIKSGVQEPKYNFMIKKLENQSDEYCEVLLAWLNDLRINEYKIAKAMWGQLPEHYWQNLNTLITAKNLPEQVALNGKFRHLREKFAKWPRAPKKIKKET
jgi:hypothetical protein